MDVLQPSVPSFALTHPRPLLHRVAAPCAKLCSETSASFVSFLPILEIAHDRESMQRMDHNQPSLNASGSTPRSAGVIQMIGVDGSWVATVGRPPQLVIARS